ncbi:hypothetical protein B0H12DRAFT_1098958 [Mycena haematopus]|nr:hypothetical protein B0H12DRAFT_1098958 [Mycena haematopus]
MNMYYIASLPDKKKKRKFIVACSAASKPVTPESINEAIQQAEQKYVKQPGTRTMQRILRPVVLALQDYDSILSTLVSADPMPTALIWGALKIVIDGAHRFIDLFDTIRKELNLLTYQLQRINSYDKLYGDYKQLQELFCNSFINMLRFWSRVDKECDTNTHGYKSVLKATTSFSTSKLNNIVKDIEDDAEKIEKFVDILEATEGKLERRAAELDRFQAEIARVAAQTRWEAQVAWHEQDEKYKQEERYNKVSAWLRADEGNEDDSRQLRFHKNKHLRGTCEWLFQHPTYIAWHDGASQPPIIWVQAPPAAGKSVLSAHLIHTLTESLGTDGVVAYHFYRFDQMHTACETLCLVASQLLDAHWARTLSISEDIFKIQQSTRARSPEKVQELIQVLLPLLPKTYFILDGLDEECGQTSRWQETAATIDFLAKLPDRVRVWCSSQIRPCISEKLKTYSVVDIQDTAKNDVAFYLSRDNPELRDLEVSDQDKDAVLKSLRDRAGVNFLWAALMVESIKKRTSLTDMKQFVREGLPETLDEHYRATFEQFAKTHRPLVSKVFALVAFARRPLRIGEVCEAAGLLLGKNPRSLRAADMPFPSSLRTLLPPLIEFSQASSPDSAECICRLFHSTVRDFLFRNPAVLRSGLDDNPDPTNLLITPDVIGNTCLLYLSQTRYSRLLTRHNNSDWLDASKKPVDQHQFQVYAAKYWDKHLDEISPTDALHHRVSAFITSVNFATCVQVQSLWVDAQFGVWFSFPSDRRAYLRRMFPKWFVTGTKDGKNLWLDFRAFVHEWKHFLRGSTIEPFPSYLPYKGELDRCWWPTLGPRNFLSKLNCRYTTFTFQRDGQDLFTRGGYYQFEGIGADGKDLVILKLSSRANGALVFTHERWVCIGTRPPTLQKTQTIVTTEKDTNWRSYVKDAKEKENIGRARTIVFSPSNDLLRIGAQLFLRDNVGDYIPIQSPPAYVEEFAIHGNVIALASRRDSSLEKVHHAGSSDESLDFLGADFLHMEETSNIPRADVESDSDSEFASDSTNTSSSLDSEDMGYETWSEPSTEYSDDFEDDRITPWAGPVSDIEESDAEAHAFLDTTLEEIELQDDENQEDEQSSLDSESSSDESDLDPAAVVGYGRWHDDERDHRNDSDAESEGGGWFANARSLGRNGYSDVVHRHGLMASLTVFIQTSTGTPTRMFHFTRSIPFPLYDSPPAFHPSKSLVIWPLSAGDVLFADYLAKTYFVRKLRPSTLHTRHIFMKCHFSPCGSHVHFACLEGQKKPVSKREKKLLGLDESPLKLALFVSTYRISQSKTSRSPPSLVHRVRINLGSVSKISVSNLPFTLTWTPTDLYFTRSDEILQVRRISLFDVGKLPTREHCVLMPREPFFLPQSAWRRKVHFFPPDGDDMDAIIIIGSETRTGSTDVHSAAADDQLSGKQKDDSMYSIKSTLGIRSPPVGCYLRDTDFGGWSECLAPSNLPDDLGIGQFDQRLEKFDPDDDCDLEPYIF